MQELTERVPFPFSVLAAPSKSDKARARRRESPLRGYFGLNGSGKSWAMVHDLIPDLDKGRPALSTVRLLDFRNPRPCELTEDTCDDWDQHNAVDHLGNHEGHMHPHPAYIPLRNWVQVLEIRRANIVLDEITGVADSNQTTSLPPAIANVLPQLRRNEVALSYTSIDFMRTNVRIREMTRTINMCASFLPVTAYGPDGEALLWKQRRLSKVQTYDAANLKSDLGDKYAERLAESHIQTAWHWIPDSAASRAYSTLEQVLHVGSLADTGRCVYCDGTRRAHECQCVDYQDRKKEARTGRTDRPDRKRRSREDRTDRAPGRDTLSDLEAPTASMSLVPSCSH